MFELKLTDEQKMAREEVRKFCEKEVRPYTRALDNEEILPYDIMRKYISVFSPITKDTTVEEVEKFREQKHKNIIADSLMSIEVCKSAPSLSLAMGASTELCAGTIMNCGNRDQKEKYALPVLRGDKIGAIAITEPTAGSDVYGIKSTARKDGDYYIINGSKTFITNAPYADVIVYYAKTDLDAPGHKGMSAFILENDMPGLTRGKPFEKMGMRGSPTGELFCEDVKVPKENLLGTENRGFYELMETFAEERAWGVVMDIGIVERILEESLKYARTRTAFGQNIGFFQGVQWRLVDMYVVLMNCYALLFMTSEIRAQGKDLTAVASASKLYAGEAATRAGLDAISIFGGYGYMAEYPVEMFMRDAKLVEIGGGTTEIMKIITANMLLKDENPPLCPFDIPADPFITVREKRKNPDK
ncbi:MAG: acyl-CoA dehydrogenase family protein [Deltaproteobacteria bacterium]|nr:MAG: acyl-CoA dehydrogenase family protein [Deltaproteobacteria bacterium]